MKCYLKRVDIFKKIFILIYILFNFVFCYDSNVIFFWNCVVYRGFKVCN